mmetsp:Transcript_43819/g.98542  ORF Transcript_43819/g.98542 Transcript_43819/m.98542 type:complete len:270 (+) Transcript_43819:986-1795(+)
MDPPVLGVAPDLHPDVVGGIVNLTSLEPHSATQAGVGIGPFPAPSFPRLEQFEGRIVPGEPPASRAVLALVDLHVSGPVLELLLGRRRPRDRLGVGRAALGALGLVNPLEKILLEPRQHHLLEGILVAPIRKELLELISLPLQTNGRDHLGCRLLHVGQLVHEHPLHPGDHLIHQRLHLQHLQVALPGLPGLGDRQPGAAEPGGVRGGHPAQQGEHRGLGPVGRLGQLSKGLQVQLVCEQDTLVADLQVQSLVLQRHLSEGEDHSLGVL